MPMPSTKETMAPILDFLADGREHLDDEIQAEVARYFELTSEERAWLMKNRIPFHKNRTAWGLVYLKDPTYLPDTRPYIEKTGVHAGKEMYRITNAGIEAQCSRVLHDPLVVWNGKGLDQARIP